MSTTPQFQVDQLVEVQARTWPGINQAGGVGRITGVATDRVSVRYVLDGRHEKEISMEYVQPHSHASGRSLRNRSLLLGRCSRCGSLKRDCGSCEDFIFQVHNSDTSSDSSYQKDLKRVRARLQRLKNKWKPWESSDSDDSIPKKASIGADEEKKKDNVEFLESDGSSNSSGDEFLHQHLLQSRKNSRSLRIRRNFRGVLETLGSSEPNKDSDASESTLSSQRNNSQGQIETILPADDPVLPSPKNDDSTSMTGWVPPNCVDDTMVVQFVDFPNFVDDLMNELEETRLPKAKHRVLALERNVKRESVGLVSLAEEW